MGLQAWEAEGEGKHAGEKGGLKKGRQKMPLRKLEQMGSCTTPPRAGEEEEVPAFLVLWRPAGPVCQRMLG